MLYFTKHKSDCMGCSACMAVCSVGCISMTVDEEGFLYPVASDRCIQCKCCEAVCPLADLTETVREQPSVQTAVCALTKDQSIWRESASGGAFSEICRAFGDDETIICGAAWDGLRVHHICVQGVRSIAPLRKSKYIASDPEAVFSQIKTYLKENRSVVFCGTPCQVAGLKRFLGKPHDRLLLIDLICHGVGSPAVFSACTEALSRQFNINVVAYEFRAKKSGRDEENVLYLKNDPYIQLFLAQNILRPSCGEHCRFRTVNRQGDITLADFKGLTRVFPNLNCSDHNYSAVVANSEKGHQVLETLKTTMETHPCTVADITKYNPLFSGQTWFSADRDRFFADFKVNPDAAIARWSKPSAVFCAGESIKQKVWRALPRWGKLMAVGLLSRLKRTTVTKESEFSSCSISKITIAKLPENKKGR